MRITGGQARGIPISTGRARQVRPATDRMREAVFSSLGDRVQGATLLDLFAGSGSYGLEALSRGAAGGVFVEKNPQAAAALQENLKAVIKSMGDPSGLAARVVRGDALKFRSERRFDLVFMDPPYEQARSLGVGLLQQAASLLEEGGTLVLELPADMEMPLGHWQLLRRIGKSGTNEPSVMILTGA
jgi:16S rRNA (guanine966-N2)-methyltransferase